MDLQCKDTTELWNLYNINKEKSIKDEITIRYMSLVKYIAGRLAIYFYDYINYEDLVSYGIFGLIDAIDKFDIEKGVKFETYATLRIKGAIIDNVRKDDWTPRSIRQKSKQINETTKTLENELGRTPTEIEIAKKLEIDIKELRKTLVQINTANITSLESFMENNYETCILDQSDFFETNIEKEDMIEQIVNIIKTLPQNEKKVIVLYYYEELTLKEISKILTLSESRISQLHTKAIKQIKSKLLS